MLLVSDLEAAGGRDVDLAYMRVAGDIAARIASGELKPGARLRSERDLAEYYESPTAPFAVPWKYSASAG